MEVDRNGLEVLDRDECLRLLARSKLGRIGVSAGALPTVLPVNFWFDGDRIVVRTGEGSKLDSATRGAVVAFEVDDFDPAARNGWTVTVTGRARHVVDEDEKRQLSQLPLHPYVGGSLDQFLVVPVELVTGRRVGDGPLRARQ